MTNMWFGESGSATQMQKVVHAVLGIGEPGTEDQGLCRQYVGFI